MKGFGTLLLLLIAAALVAVARGGHEVPVYPSFYPHEIEIRALAREQAADTLLKADIHAYVGPPPGFAGPLPESIRTVGSLGAFVVVRINPQSPLAKDEPSGCAVAKRVVRDLAAKPEQFIFHPYPVTPFHGDYLHHADLAEAAKARYSDAAGEASGFGSDIRIKANGRLAQSRPEWSAGDADWDAEVSEIDAAELVASATFTVNGWIAPPWVRSGWFHAERLLGDAMVHRSGEQRTQSDLQRLTAGNFDGVVERINLERDLVTSLTAGCRSIVAGYTVKREYFNAEFSTGIENVGHDAIEGLQSPMFIRTVKLKDFPWNGWLVLGVDAQPNAAWNPIGGMNDRFGRLMWFALGDPALMPSPYGPGWMFNRIADIPPDSVRMPGEATP
jgi:hypothetical protein